MISQFCKEATTDGYTLDWGKFIHEGSAMSEVRKLVETACKCARHSMTLQYGTPEYKQNMDEEVDATLQAGYITADLVVAAFTEINALKEEIEDLKNRLGE